MEKRWVKHIDKEVVYFEKKKNKYLCTINDFYFIWLQINVSLSPYIYKYICVRVCV